MFAKCAVLFVILFAGLVPNVSRASIIGDPAPPLTVKEWLKGGPVEFKPGTNIFVLEIWSTTGAASRAAINYMNYLQNRFKTNGVVVVGVSTEDVPVIKAFLEHEGTNIQYAVAADDHERTSMPYMKPAGQVGIPYAFVVGSNGIVLWHGHVLRGLEQAMEQIIAGNFSLDHSRKLDEASHQMEQYLALVRHRDPRLRAAGLVLLAARTNDVELLCDLAFQISTAPQLPRRDLLMAGEALDQAEKIASTNSPRVMIYRAVWLFQGGKRDAGLTLGRQALADAQSPEDKRGVESLLRTMEDREKVILRNRSQSKTNLVHAATAPGQTAPAGPALIAPTNPPPVVQH